MESVEGVESIDKIKVRVVGIDIRLDRTTYAIVDIKGDIVAQDQFDTMDFPDVNDFVSALSEKVMMLVEENGGYESIRSVGVSAPSANSLTGCVENAANLPWKGVVPLAAMLRDRLGLAVAVANDAHITALSEKNLWQCPRHERLCCCIHEPWRSGKLLLFQWSAPSGL